MDDLYLKGETWGFPGAAVEHIETHAAHVFLVANRAFKIKKDVKLPYLDFSTIEKRRSVLHHELEINRAYAPEIYRSLTDVRGEPVLVMNRFAARDMLSSLAGHGQLDDELVIKLASSVAEAHAIAPLSSAEGAAIMTGLGAQLSTAFTSSPDVFPPPETLEFHALYEEALKRLTPLLKQRSTQGLVRRCHGDMHCGNIVVINGKPTLFDAIEFSERIATIDVLYDLAFLIMDLLRLDQRRAANLLLNRYLHLRRDFEDLSGLAAMPLFLATRAGVRALVTADLVHELPVSKSLHERGKALDYFRAANAFLKPSKARLISIGGLSGTGKSTLAQSFAFEIGGGAGAILIRSDIERKALARVPETAKLPAGSYTRSASLEVYDRMFARAGKALAAGCSVILDAVFAEPAERASAESLASKHRAPFTGLWLEAGPDTLKVRVAARRGDASDADSAVIDRQLTYDVGTVTWHRIDASGDAARTQACVRRMLQSQHTVLA